ncbi:MAG TPA: response regulator [Acetobacteraceae bacterium]|jgi:DNA-binding response OmpR family regulator|nr:response regulator [Acetobacteraceae bacterium]
MAGTEPVAKHVLVAENEALIGLLLRDVLSDAGYEVSVVANGDAAMLAAQAKAPDVAVLNWKMPGVAGVELVRELRRIVPRLPVVIVTGYRLAPEDVKDLGDGPPLVIMSKPVDLEGLLGAVRAMIRRKRR